MDKKKYKVLIVDDEAELRESVKEIIQNHGQFQATAVSSAKEALEIIKKESQDIAIIISDYLMPEINGLEFRSAMLEKWKDIPFVILSA